MTYVTANIDLTESQMRKFHKAIEDKTGVALQISKSQVGTEHGMEMKLTKSQVNKLRKSPNAANIKFSKTQLQKQGRGFLDAILGIGKAILPKVLPILGTLGLSAASGAISGATNKAVKKGTGLKRAGSGLARAGSQSGGQIPLYVSADELADIFRVIKLLEDKKILPKNTNKRIAQKVKKQRGGFISGLLAGLAGPLLGNLVSGLLGNTQQTGSGIREA